MQKELQHFNRKPLTRRMPNPRTGGLVIQLACLYATFGRWWFKSSDDLDKTLREKFQNLLEHYEQDKCKGDDENTVMEKNDTF